MPKMLPTIVRNLFGGPATRLYPVEVRKPFERTRGHIVFDDEKCTLCGGCARRCPAAAIEIDKEKKELIFYPGRCIICEVCAENCPRGAITVKEEWRKPFYEVPVEVHHPKGKKEKAS
ncbi:MAG: Putative ech hydrogenase subunit F [Thermoanaerobacterales bacterium 50_218]|nr:MAG: Putative ech hydrogenase subunit F [Thermoanaerobacterales bacterium 50_218]HAA90753.1 hypothetical protein [Peptococcaceae bacterium]